MSRPTWAEIDLDAVANNINSVRGKVGDNTTIIAIVKANAYGHGIIEVSKRLIRENVDMLGVATVEDAVKLRKNNIDRPILLLACILPEQAGHILEYSITPTIAEPSIAEELSNLAEKSMSNVADKLNVHVKIDTGMGGFGIAHQNAVNTIAKINTLPRINIEGVFTHLTSSDGSNRHSVNEQIDLFTDIVAQLEAQNIKIPLKHTSNSSIALQKPKTFNTVRPGISIYGLYSSGKVPKSYNLRQVMSLKTRIVNIQQLEKGKTVSYGRTFKAKRDSLIATLPIGYSDGYRRELSNRGKVLINGKTAPIAGVIRMDFTYIDITDVPDAKIGDEAVIFGKQGDEFISIESIAETANTIPYEITCAIGSDVPRIYLEQNA